MRRWIGVALVALFAAGTAAADGGLDFERLAALRSVREISISPDGRTIAYVLEVPRRPGRDDDGSPHRELHVVSQDGVDRAFVHGEVSVSRLEFTPDGSRITYIAKREGNEKRAIWSVPVDGGESRSLLEHDEEITEYRISPDGKRVAFLAVEERDEKREKARKKGYRQEVYEEDWRHRRVWIAALPPQVESAGDPTAEKSEEDDEPRALELDGSVFDVRWMPNGEQLLLTVAPTPLIDDRYMRRRVRLVDAGDGKTRATFDTPGKMGGLSVSPDGKWVAIIATGDVHDPAAGRLLAARITGGKPRDLLPGFEGHVRAATWKDERTILFIADIGTETMLAEIRNDGDARMIHLRSGEASDVPILTGLDLSADGRRVALQGERPTHPREVFTTTLGEPGVRRLTDSNPWLAAVTLAPQRVIRWKARDGLELEGMLLLPAEPAGTPPPLLLMVHGGPESHDRNGWVTSYSRPGQLAAAGGYAVLYPNYRGSTGRGVDFSKLGQGDAAGPEFDDLVDAVDHLVDEELADTSRVGILGGSYGGYATAWCSTRYSERFRAGVMFVGISNKVSKGLTTDIPFEDKMVHTGFDPWTHWDFSLDRSPVNYAENSKTALLIAGGTADTRVHPSQSLQLYRALKLIGRTPVRYLRYPGEGHGNRKAAARDDYTRRLMRWMDHFVIDGATELPAWDLPPDLGDDDDDDEDGEDGDD